MHNSKIGIYEKAINNKWSIEEKIQIAKNAGYDFIEFSIDESDEKLSRLNFSQKKIDEIKLLLVKNNFKFNSMTLSGHRKYPFGSSDPEIVKKAFWIMERAIYLSKELGIYNIQLAGYDVYYEKSNDETKKRFMKNMKKVAKMAEENSIMLSFEIMDTPFMGTISRSLNYVKEINSPWLKIYPDIGNLYQWAGEKLEEEFLLGKGYMTGMHFKDTKPNVFRDVPWGEGTVDFVKVFKILRKINWVGPFLIEMWSSNEKNESMEENVEKIKVAKEFFNQKLKESYE
ncbi:MAG: L-ribulose-5-phosphate 3-epimerase [Mycoplasmatales bacterium]|nr:L-ribulose-5-phosphate 3-epimerase [Mycoplasmatales bacterium]